MTSEPIFNNREIAIGVWSALLVTFVVARPGMRSSLRGVFRAFLQRQILIMYALMIGYVVLIVWGLRSFGLWEIRQLKDTAIWFVVVAATSFFRLPKSADDVAYFKEALKDNIKLIVIIEFIIAFYAGSLFAELLIVPFSAFLGLMIVFSEREQRYVVVTRFLNWVAILLGASILIHAVYRLVTNILGFATLQTLSDFILPAILTVLFLPFIFLATVFINYEADFSALKQAVKDDHLRRYAKRKALLRFGWRTSLVKRWRRGLFLENHHTENDIDRSIASVMERWERERNPPAVPVSQGWSPYAAKEFLAVEGLSTGYYEPVPGQGWYASKIRNSSDKDSLSTFEYYVEGDSVSATTLGLVLEAFQPQPLISDMKEFMKLVVLLYNAALHDKMPEDLMEEMLVEDKVERVVDGRIVAANNKPWKYNNRAGFTLEFSIRAQNGKYLDSAVERPLNQ